MKINQIISEIDRRGFLKGMGAAAIATAAGSADAAISTDDIAGWFISTETSKFGVPTQKHALKNDFIYDGSTLSFSIGNGQGREMLKPGSVVKFIAGGGIQTAKVNDYGSVNFTPYIKQLQNTNKVDIRFTYINRITRVERTHEREFDVSGFNEVIEYFKNPQQYKKKDKTRDSSGWGDVQPDSLRNSNLERMQNMSNPSASYAGRIRARIKPNITFTDDIAGNPSTGVELRTSPDGTIIGRNLISSSGNKSWDDAVLKAIDKTATLPRGEDGQVPSSLNLSFRPRD